VPDAVQVRALLLDDSNALLFSAASAWELAIKTSMGRLTFATPLETYLPQKLASEGLEPLAITIDHATRTESLPWHHRDPFDRLLVAQAQLESLEIITSDKVLRRYDVGVVW